MCYQINVYTFLLFDIDTLWTVKELSIFDFTSKCVGSKTYIEIFYKYFFFLQIFKTKITDLKKYK